MTVDERWQKKTKEDETEDVDKSERLRMKANTHAPKTILINFEVVQILITVNETFSSFH